MPTEPQEARSAARDRGLRLWPHGFLGVAAVAWGVIAVWSPDGEPWWWRLLLVALVAEIAFVFGRESRA